MKALIIDDDMEIQSLLGSLLVRRGFEVDTADGLQDLAYQPERLDVELILLDFDLGTFTGLDVMHFLQDLGLRSNVALLSGCGKGMVTHILHTGRSQGLRMLGHLPKPIRIKALDALLARGITQQTALPRAELERAITEHELVLAYQPKLELATGHVIGVEALVRWQHPTLGMISPDRFIPLAEESELILPLTWQVFDMALDLLRRWRSQGIELDMAVNLSPRLLRVPDFLSRIDRSLAHHGVDWQGLTIELTENAGIQCFSYARHLLGALRDHGCRLALDDFGTGYSSMTQLYRLPFDELKVDRSFVSLSDKDKEAQAITRTIVDLGKRLHLDVVGEGIETLAHVRLLEEAGCTSGQGYLFARPMPENELTQWLSALREKNTPLDKLPRWERLLATRDSRSQ
ncbi:diguanylate phosphodiesterase [Litchfieldella qijiaojingensis]|uniref:Diguanylate phosphodiesterase n=1 Tax=Litchfieldella qijiaojingensis TaxID=980347 RepID=A0ABQ2YXB3_9GAMM|nr:EAL domain-containing response regulator [Halomonas qijiaojingensis]GGX98447.1 diguanylate phosphodiesterase [Halomonas qijiaojingensis]